jgi:hypothetical protein
MKQFKVISFSKQQARRELTDFRALLNDPAKPELKEREDILPFFTPHEHAAGTILGGWMGCESTVDLQVRKSLLKLLHSRVGDLGIGELKR